MRINRRDFLRLSGAGVAGMLLTSCAPAGTAPMGVTAPEEVEVLGFPRTETVFAQQLTGRNATPSNFNFWAGWRQQDRGMQQVMNESLWVDDFEAGVIYNALAAEPPTYSDDFQTMTIKLREGMMWSDGNELTADDLAFTLEFIKAAPAANYNASVARQVESATATDKTTVVVQLNAPNPRFHFENFSDLWGSLWVMPKHVFEQFMADDGTVDTEAFFAFEYNPPLSSGPYVLHSFDPAGNWTAWEKRADWDKTPTGVMFGEPKPQYVVFVDYGDFTARIISMTRHEVDMIDLDLPAIRAVTRAEPSARGYYADQGFPWIQSNRHPGVGGIVFNTLKPPFDNKDVRWALTLAMDPVSYNLTAYDGCAAMNPLPIVVNGPQMKEPYVEPLVAWLTDYTIDVGEGEMVKVWDPTAPTRLVEEARARGFTFPDDPQTIQNAFGYGSWQYNPEAAAKLLKKAGFSQNADGQWLLPDGAPFRFTVYTSTTPGRWPHQNAQAAYVEWRRFGFDVSFEVGDAGQLRIEMGQYEVAGGQTHGSNYLENTDLFRTFTSFHTDYLEPDLTKRQFGHSSRWTNPRVDEILDQIRSSNPNDTATLQPIGLELLKIMIEEMPTISATTSLDPYAVSTYYWTGWPSAENHFTVPYHHYPTFKYLLTRLEP
ncbi:MAG: twin-arginine translocation signal domain-containing protein, partial [Caldilineaceae bacterium]|nr:twin-arginine translocation signal domain-containing protein [Caldilineaceae bacterium]